MTKKDEFKIFASKNKYLANAVNSGKTTWQKLFEMFDIYGEESDIWNSFKNFKEVKEEKNLSSTVKSVIDNIKKIDVDKLEENIGSLQKALGFLEEIVVTKDSKKEDKPKKEKKKSINDIERFFDD